MFIKNIISTNFETYLKIHFLKSLPRQMFIIYFSQFEPLVSF